MDNNHDALFGIRNGSPSAGQNTYKCERQSSKSSSHTQSIAHGEEYRAWVHEDYHAVRLLPENRHQAPTATLPPRTPSPDPDGHSVSAGDEISEEEDMPPLESPNTMDSSASIVQSTWVPKFQAALKGKVFNKLTLNNNRAGTTVVMSEKYTVEEIRAIGAWNTNSNAFSQYQNDEEY